eukprot:332763-Chlamydomonas_euryale.AAC.5
MSVSSEALVHVWCRLSGFWLYNPWSIYEEYFQSYSKTHGGALYTANSSFNPELSNRDNYRRWAGRAAGRALGGAARRSQIKIHSFFQAARLPLSVR